MSKTRTPDQMMLAFGYDGGWSVERKPSRKAKARERAALFYLRRVGEREREAAVAATYDCIGCGAELKDDPHQTGPRKQWCSMRCYQRHYQRNLRAGSRSSDRGIYRCECGKVCTRPGPFAGHQRACRVRREASR